MRAGEGWYSVQSATVSNCHRQSMEMRVQGKRRTRTRPGGDVALSTTVLYLYLGEFQFDRQRESRFNIFVSRIFRVLLTGVGRAECVEGILVCASRNEINTQDNEKR